MHNELRLYPPTVWSSNWPDGDLRHGKVTREVPYECYEHAIIHHRVGDTVTHYAGAPGTGSITYRITRIDPTGVYGVVVSDTIRELDPSECF